jgi:hypothetical protein
VITPYYAWPDAVSDRRATTARTCALADRTRALGNTRRAMLLAALESLLPSAIEALERGEQLIEIV